MSDLGARRRVERSLFGGAAVGATGFFAGLAVAPLAAEDLTGTVTWSGLPGALGILGTAAGATLVSRLLATGPRRRGLTVGYLVGVAGAVLAATAVAVGSFPLFLVGACLFGVGNAANQLTRYVVAELRPAAQRGRALGWIVWAGTIGGVLGPNLLGPAGGVAEALGRAELIGPYAVAAVVTAAVPVLYRLTLRPDPATLAVAEDDGAVDDDRGGTLQRVGVVRVALVVMITGQIVMVLLMSMTPVHIREAGGDLGRVGLVLSAHIFGMYGLAPVAGWIEDRLGSRPTIGLALTTLAVAGGLAATAPVGGLQMALGLFLLGLGWSFGFVAGSTMLARGVPVTVRAAVQGRVETVVWASSAVASLSAGVLVSTIGYAGLCLLGVALLAVPAVVVLGRGTGPAVGSAAGVSPPR